MYFQQFVTQTLSEEDIFAESHISVALELYDLMELNEFEDQLTPSSITKQDKNDSIEVLCNMQLLHCNSKLPE